MTIDAPAGVAIVESTTTDRDNSSYVDWPAIIAGIVLASAISLVLISFGSAVGLNFLDFGYGDGPNPIFVGIAAATWFLWVQISSFMAGGYLTGRLRRRYFDANEDESDLRDGAHGLLVWAGAAILGTVIAVGGIGAAANAVGSAAATATTAASNVAEGTADAVDPNAYFIDTMFRSTQPVDAEAARGEAGRIFAQAALGDGTVADADRTYLANVVAANTGIAPDEAQARVDAAITSVEQARQDALEAARIARNTAIIGAFLLAASLLVSAIGAFWAAQKGGNHRDENTVFAGVFRRF
ncbi:MAG: hypothetical protein ACK4G5_07075 [Devosia sp.]|jgi:hypothetical protein|nr:hypothetical protein [Alphaproteobacteria bacterium]MBU1562215.1 hypothetical protein [Alphaproteobacteria bacterium]MBU2302813.1 hypothetical protein [Alphaproteobacteria bacterium]MBU2366442.1 hypothetical protein [Alphaproteobacteria bacterium]